MTEIHKDKGSDNVYRDLKVADAESMYVKARLASKIGKIIDQRCLTQQQAANILKIPQPKLSRLLRGKFRGISETKMITCLNLLGNDVEIVVRQVYHDSTEGHTQVTFA